MSKPTIFLAAFLGWAFFCGSVMSPSCAQSASSPSTNVLSIEDAVRQGLAKNIDLKIAVAQQRKMRGQLSEAKTERNFTVVGAASQTRNKSETDYSLEGMNIVITPQNQTELALTLQQKIDISGKIASAVSLADFETIAADLGAEAVKNNVVAQIRAAYLDCLRAQALEKAAEQDEQNAQVRLRFIEAQVKAGLIPKIDLLRAQTALATQQNSASVAQRQIDLSIAQLKRAIGLSQAAFFTVSQDNVTATFSDEAVAGDDAPIRRAEILEAQANVEAAKRGIEIAKRWSSPDLIIGAGVSSTPGSSSFGVSASSAQITATISIPLYDGGLAKAKETQAKASVEMAQAQLEDTKQLVDLEVKQARIFVNNSSQRLDVIKAALTEAKEGYRLANLRFTQGVSPLIEVSDAQTALTQAQTDEINALWDLFSARNAYNRALGLYAK